MTRPGIFHWLAALLLACCLPAFAATIYKSIDANGVVRYSDTRPAEDILVETIEIHDQSPEPSEQEKQRLLNMRETTDRMVADRMAREKHRAELRQLDAQTRAEQSAQDGVDDYDDSTLDTGYYGYPARRPWWPTFYPRPRPPIAHPPMLPPVENRPPNIRPLPGNDYPASLIRKSYDPRVREALR